LQRGSAEGVTVDVYAPGTAIFDLRRMESRKQTPATARCDRPGHAALRRRFGNRSRRRTTTARSAAVTAVTSSTGRRFYVGATRGTLKLPEKNLGDLACVF
jgi:hypothetical protein